MARAGSRPRGYSTAARGMWSAVASAAVRGWGDAGKAPQMLWVLRTTSPTTATLALWAFNRKRRSYDVLNLVA